MKIIQGNKSHIEACLQIARSLPRYFTPEGINNLGNDIVTHQLYVAIHYGKVRGFLTSVNKYPHVAEISWFAVQPKYQHKGYGTALMDFTVTRLKSKGYQLLQVKTLSPEVDYQPYEPTRRFYQKSGFILTDIIDPYPGWDPGNPCAVYVKIL